MYRENDRDEQDLVLRHHARAPFGITANLDLDYARTARAVFNRALRGPASAQRARLQTLEAARLDALTWRMRKRDDLSADEIIRGLRGLRHQRKTLFAA
jgi:hypothetical protein